MYIIAQFEQYLAVFLDYAKFYQPGTAAGPAHARTTGRGVSGAMGGTQQVLAKGIEKVTFIPVELQRPVRTAVEISVHGTTEANDEGRAASP